ncbi:hypothetical protein PsorP6_012073 [Peronosclerospora sorghi]|uniref:Uncharacterized protein n=1 Tax=Peronosclerospora sorghi TaxID=230839 RepID=A0ACC0WJ15_9STRA|nr:hypothetical protein PsorP6_012073 [Peronosclerospora sorghi]
MEQNDLVSELVALFFLALFSYLRWSISSAPLVVSSIHYGRDNRKDLISLSVQVDAKMRPPSLGDLF